MLPRAALFDSTDFSDGRESQTVFLKIWNLYTPVTSIS